MIWNRKRLSAGLVLLGPCNSTNDRVEGGLGALAVLDEGGDVTTGIDLAHIEHGSASNVATFIFDRLDPPA